MAIGTEAEESWHILLDGVQRGPYTRQEVSDQLIGGTLSTAAWARSGRMQNWLPLPAFAVFGAAPSASAPAPTSSQVLVEPQSSTLESLKRTSNWLIGVEADDATTYFREFQVTTRLREAIIEGRFRRTCPVVVHHKTEAGAWTEAKSTLLDFARSRSDLRLLYEPVWSHALSGLKWGVITGVAIKLADTFLLLLYVEPALAFLFAIAVGVCFIPRVGLPVVIATSFAMAKFSRMNFFFVAIAAALVGAALGSLPGMAIGGIVGYVRRRSLPRAKDALPEAHDVLAKAVVIPLVAGIGLVITYIFMFNPWLASMLE